MKKQIFTIPFILSAVFIIGVFSLSAQEKKSGSTFSHKGLKVALGLGAFDNSASNLSDGQAVFLNLGYGFTDKSTLWLSFVGSEHPKKSGNNIKTEFDGFEINYQHKLRSESRLQPYGKIGLGAYQLKDRSSDGKVLGGGIALAVGADYFLSRHFGLGLELSYKGIEYSRRSEKVAGGDLLSDLNPSIEGESFGLMVTFTIQ